MRNPNRLDKFYTELKNWHKVKVPDWRFGQLMVNFIQWYGNDIFYIEDEDFLDLFEKFLHEGCDL